MLHAPIPVLSNTPTTLPPAAGARYAGQSVLQAGGSAVDAVEAAVVALEADPHFNAGKGAVYTASGRHELEASIMTGDKRCAALGMLLAALLAALVGLAGLAGRATWLRWQHCWQHCWQDELALSSTAREGAACSCCSDGLAQAASVPLRRSGGVHGAGGSGRKHTGDGPTQPPSCLPRPACRCGAATLLATVKHPIKLARLVMERTPHNFLGGPPAEAFAAEQGLELVGGLHLLWAFLVLCSSAARQAWCHTSTPAPLHTAVAWLKRHGCSCLKLPGLLPAWLKVPNSYFDTDVRYQQWQRCKAVEAAAQQQGSNAGAGHGPGSGSQHTSADAAGTAGSRHEATHHMQTVGAVAVDSEGRLAAATSTGGRSNKWDGRIGDTPINGAGGLHSWLAGYRPGAGALHSACSWA